MRSAILLAMLAGMVWAQGDGQLAGRPEFQEFQRERAAQAQIDAYKAQVAAAQARLAELKKRYTDGYPDVQAAQRELVDVQKQLEAVQQRFKLSLQGGSLAPANDGMKIPLQDRWWRNPATGEYLGLSAAQASKMDDVVSQFKPQLLAVATKLKSAERALDALVSAEPLDESKVSAQIDSVAFLRSELEKANGHMLLALRKLLTPEQWSKLNQSFTLSLTPKEPTR